MPAVDYNGVMMMCNNIKVGIPTDLFILVGIKKLTVSVTRTKYARLARISEKSVIYRL